jgi:hypothetical protein
LKIKAVLDSIDALPDALKALYVPAGDKFTLDGFDGAVPGFITASEHDTIKADAVTTKVKLDEFRENNRGLFNALKLFGIEDPTKAGDVATELTTLRASAADLKGKGVTKPSDLETQIAAAVKAAIAPLSASLAASETARTAADAKAAESALTSTLTASALKSGVRPTAVRDVLARAKDVYRVVDGAIVPLLGDTVLRDAEGHPKSPDAWFVELGKSPDAAHLFTESTGAGADGKSAGQAGAKVITNVDPLSFGRQAADIASGKVVVQ